MDNYKYIYTIEGLSGSYHTLTEARAMVRHFLRNDKWEADKLRGCRGMKRNVICRHNLNTGATREYKW